MKHTKKLILISLISLILFILIYLEVYLKGFLFKMDLSLNSLIPHIQNSAFTVIAKITSFIFDTAALMVITIILCIFLWFKRGKKYSLFFLITMLFNGLIILLLKDLFQRPRPLNSLIVDTSFAFPSGHTASAVVFFGLITYLIFKKSKSQDWKIGFFVFSIFMVLFIGFIRLYLNVHWFTDVLGGLAIGTFILTISILINESLEKTKPFRNLFK